MATRVLTVPGTLFLLVALCSCGSSNSAGGGTDPEDATTPGTMPSAVPAATGEVTTGTPVTVIEQGDQPVQLCLGATTAIFPPDCGGPEVVGWDWSSWDEDAGDYMTSSGTTFGQFVVTGTWDGSTLTLSDAVTASDAGAPSDPEQPTASPPAADRADLERTARTVGRDLPGAGGAYVEQGQVHVDVTYDDGSLQAWCDQEYGEGVVVVTGQLHDVG